MPKRERYIPGVPCWVDTIQPDPEAAVAFYSGLFGWEFRDVMGPESENRYFIAQIGGGNAGAVASAPEGGPPATWNTYVSVEDVDETAAKVRDAGGTVVTEPFDVMDAGRMAVFADPEGATFCAWQPQKHIGATVVNEHGAVNFNGLNTRDVDGAKGFYGAVFGWTTLTLDGGGEMWTLPGYGDHLEESNPDMRKNMAEAGAPAGFEDVVASITPIAGDQPDVPAHWDVTFGADDADAIAAKATELGGTVIVPPMDAPWVRMTVVADPAGATFIATKFVPENRDLASPSDPAASAA